MGAAAAITPFLPLISTALGGLASAGAAAQAGEEDAQAAEQNARNAGLLASDAIQRGEQEGGRIRMMASRMIGEQKVAFAASGVDSSTGSARELQGDTRMMSELDALTARNNAAREAYGLRLQGQQYRDQARRSRQRGGNQAAGTILGTFAQGLGQYGTTFGWK